MKKLIYIFAALTFLTASCISDPITPDDGPGKEAANLTFSITSTSGTGGTITRATPEPTRAVIPGDDTYNENELDANDIHVFFFDRNTAGNPLIFYPLADRLTITEDSFNPGTYTVTLALEPDTGAGDTFPSFDPEDLVSHNVIMYVVANSGKPRSDFSPTPADETVSRPLADIRAMIIEATFNTVAAEAIVPQQKFVMEASAELYISGWSNIATMELKRVASKIELGVYNAAAAGYTATAGRVKLINYLDKSALGKVGSAESFTPASADYLTSDYISLPELNSGDGTSATISYAEPFYSYPSDWSSDPDNAAFLLLEVMWHRSEADPSTASPYYYKIPIGRVPTDAAGSTDYSDKLLRNYIYRFFVNITALGGTDPLNPTELEANVDIIGWTDNIVDTAIQKFDWLFVEQQYVIIYPVPGENIQEYLIPYKSNSDLYIPTGAPLTASYPDYANGAGGTTRYYAQVAYPANPSDSQITQYPYVDTNYIVETQRYIKIRSRTPVNYVPKTIVFRVYNEAEIYAHVTVVHYPAIYVTAESSTRSGSNSQYLFTVTTIALMGTENFDWSWKNSTAALRAKQYTLGDPKDASGNYVDNAENAWVVSPKFVIQSQRGYTSIQSRGDAVSRCSNSYSESTVEGSNYAAGTWRLPTLAELYLIHKIQNDSNSAIQSALAPADLAKRAWAIGKYLLTGSSNSGGTVFNMSSSGGLYGDGYSGNTNPSIWHVTVCVRDIYR